VNKFFNTIQARNIDCLTAIGKSTSPKKSVSKRNVLSISYCARDLIVSGVVFFAGYFPARNLSGSGLPAGSLLCETHSNFSLGF